MSDPTAPTGIFGEALQSAVDAVQAMWNGKRAFHYQAVFFGEGDAPTLHGEKVLADLARFCRANTTTFDKDARIHALLEGRREVFLRIAGFLGVDPQEALKYVEVKDE